MNKTNDIYIYLQPLSAHHNPMEILVTFQNNGEEPYFLDQKRAFYQGRYTLDCLIVMHKETHKETIVPRKIKLKVKASVFPDDYIEIKPGEAITQEINLNEHFRIPADSQLTVEYHCHALNPVTNTRELLESVPLSLHSL